MSVAAAVDTVLPLAMTLPVLRVAAGLAACAAGIELAPTAIMTLELVLQ
jgi:hypothetical protein